MNYSKKEGLTLRKVIDLIESFSMSDSQFAVITTSGKQFTVTPGSKIIVDRIEAEIGSTVTLDNVLLAGSGEGDTSSVQVGTPNLSGASVKAKVVAHNRAKKVIIFKKIRRTGYMKKQGHRQDVSHLMIESINL